MEEPLEPATEPPRGGRPPRLSSFLIAPASLAGVLLLSIPLSEAAALLLGVPRSALAGGAPLAADVFTALALGTDASLLFCAAFLLALLGGGPVPLRPPLNATLPSLAALGAVVGLNAAGSSAVSWLGESYLGLPRARSFGEVAAVGAVGCLLAPLAEELFFREILLVRIFPEGRRGFGIAVSSLLFGLLHAGSVGPVHMATLALMGLALAWLRVRTASLGPPIAVHAANNALALVLGVQGGA